MGARHAPASGGDRLVGLAGRGSRPRQRAAAGRAADHRRRLAAAILESDCWADMTRTFLVCGEAPRGDAASGATLSPGARGHLRGGPPRGSLAASSTTTAVTCSRPRGTARSAPVGATIPRTAFSSRSDTESGCGSTRHPAWGAPGPSRWSPETCSRLIRGCDGPTSAWSASRTWCWSPTTAASC